MNTQATAAGYLGEIWRCRYFWLSLVKMDLRTRYRRTILGVGWSLLSPLAMASVLCVVFHRLFNMSIAEYAPFVLSGLAFWAFFTGVILQGCECFYQGETYIRQHPAPLAIYPLRTALGCGFHFLLALCVVIGLKWFFQGFTSWTALVALVPALAIMFVLAWAAALIAGFCSVFFPDIKHLTEVGLQILFYATPIFYPPEILRDRGLSWAADFNPIASLVQLVRLPVLKGEIPPAGAWIAACVATAAVVVVGGVIVARWQKRLIFHL